MVSGTRVELTVKIAVVISRARQEAATKPLSV